MSARYWPTAKTMVAGIVRDEILSGVANPAIAEKIARGVNSHQGWKLPDGSRARLTASELADAISLARMWTGSDSGAGAVA